jgi:hypothetical protein
MTDNALETMSDADLKWHRDGYAKVVATGKSMRGRELDKRQIEGVRLILAQVEEEIARRAKPTRTVDEARFVETTQEYFS